jgi:hypothetical protein
LYNVLPLHCAFHHCSKRTEKILKAQKEQETEVVNSRNLGIKFTSKWKSIRIIIRRERKISWNQMIQVSLDFLKAIIIFPLHSLMTILQCNSQ